MSKLTNTFRVLISVIFLASSLMACGGGGSSSKSDSSLGADPTASGHAILSDQENLVLTVDQENQLPPPVPAGDATAVEFPRGIYSSSADREALEQPYTEGALVRGAWDKLEVSRGAYDFSDLEHQVDIVRSTGKKWTLAIAAGPSTPGFYGNERVSFVWRNENQSMPTPWDTDYLTALRELMTAIANVYGNDPDLQMVYVPMISPNGIEGSWTEQTTPSWSSFGYTEQRHANGILEAIGIVTDTFPGKAVAVELHQINNSTTVPEIVIAGMDKTRVGIAAWWLGQGTYQPNLQEVFRQFSGAKIGQIIAAQANEPDPDKGFRLTGYDGQPWGLEGVYQMAQNMGISYVEPWPLDVKGYPEILGNWSF